MSAQGHKKAAMIGGGVIGAGWAARFLLHGWDVALYDPDPETARKLAEVMANARLALPAVLDQSLPEEGELNLPASLAEAVAEATWVQESVPERLPLKHQILAEIQAAAPAMALIGSSTSGFMPSELQEDAANPAAILVAHPYNPVYLLPLVELVASPASAPQTIDAARQILESLGMKVLLVEKEIPAHVGDRLLEAVWRECLWLIKDGIATTQEIDDCIAYGFGLRWGQMGIFETYRVAGGEAGMANFIGQFGPALKWPWTRLMDVPDLDEELVAKIASQSDAQSGHLSIRELERIRDENIAGFLRVLKDRDWGAGRLLRQHDARLEALNPAAPLTHLAPQAEPYRLLDLKVLPSWIDYNGHMTEHRYLQVFGDTSDALLAAIGVNEDYLATGRSYYTVETHIMHMDEVKLGASLYSSCQILAVDEKRLHLFHRIHAAGDADGSDRVIASAEQMLLHVDQKQGRAVPADPALLAQLLPLATAHNDLPQPPAAGRHVGQRR